MSMAKEKTMPKRNKPTEPNRNKSKAPEIKSAEHKNLEGKTMPKRNKPTEPNRNKSKAPEIKSEHKNLAGRLTYEACNGLPNDHILVIADTSPRAINRVAYLFDRMHELRLFDLGDASYMYVPMEDAAWAFPSYLLGDIDLRVELPIMILANDSDTLLCLDRESLAAACQRAQECEANND